MAGKAKKPTARALWPDFSLLAPAVLAAAWAAEARGQIDFELLAQNCAACHNSAAMPVAEMSREQLLQTLLRFKSGERYSTIMGRILEPLGRDDIADLVEALKGEGTE